MLKVFREGILMSSLVVPLFSRDTLVSRFFVVCAVAILFGVAIAVISNRFVSLHPICLLVTVLFFFNIVATTRKVVPVAE